MIKMTDVGLRPSCRRGRSHGLATASTIALTLGLLATAAPLAAQTTGEGVADPNAPAVVQYEPGEIIVTANRREQSVTDIPYNITAVGASSLTASGVSSANDLTKVVAGLGNVAEGPASRYGESRFSLRGLRTDNAGADIFSKITANSVSTYYGETPIFFAVMLKDLERVEVLRGPQGTLYGSGSQGGTIRFIPKRPSFSGISGEINASTGITYSTSKLNKSVDGVINLPLADNLAVRVSGAYVSQAGFIDQVNLYELDANGVPVPSVPGDLTSGPKLAPARNTNSYNQWVVRGAVRYQPTDWLDLDVSYVHQRTHSNDSQEANPNYVGKIEDLAAGPFPNAPVSTNSGGQLKNTSDILQPVTATLDMVSGTASADLGFAELTATSSYYEVDTRSIVSATSTYIFPTFNFFAFYNFYPRFMARLNNVDSNKGFAQEVRLVSQGDTPFSYVIGGYYQKENRRTHVPFTAPGIAAFSNAQGSPSANPQLGDLIFDATRRFRTSDIAAFGELTYHITRAWQVTGGIRVFKNKGSTSSFNTSPFVGALFGDGVTEPIAEGASSSGGKSSASDKVFKINTSYNINPDTMMYATFSQGFRRGGPNGVSITGFNASLLEFQSYRPDFVNNYEVGLKGMAFDRTLTYAISGYWIDQKDFQFSGATPSGFVAVFNGGKARSRGIEFESSWRPTDVVTLGLGYAYTDAQVVKGAEIFDLAPGTLIDSDPATNIVLGTTLAKGGRLPSIPKHNLTISVDYKIPLAGDSKIILHGNANYRSKMNNSITINSSRFAVLPGFLMADARVTYDSGRAWSSDLFVTNLTNAIGYTGTTYIQNVPDIFARRIVSTPRTFGAGLHYQF